MNRYPIEDRELPEWLQGIEEGNEPASKWPRLHRAALLLCLVATGWAVIILAAIGCLSLIGSSQ